MQPTAMLVSPDFSQESFMPAGQILPPSTFDETANLPANLRHLSALAAYVPSWKWNAGNDPRTSVVTDSIAYAGVTFLLIRFQSGNCQCNWLVDPADERVWAMLRAWSAAHTAIIAVNTSMSEHTYVRVSLDGAIGEQAEAKLAHLKEASSLELVNAAIGLLKSRTLIVNATSDIPEIAHLEYVAMALLSSPKANAGFEQYDRRFDALEALMQQFYGSSAIFVHS